MPSHFSLFSNTCNVSHDFSFVAFTIGGKTDQGMNCPSPNEPCKHYCDVWDWHGLSWTLSMHFCIKPFKPCPKFRKKYLVLGVIYKMSTITVPELQTLKSNKNNGQCSRWLVMITLSLVIIRRTKEDMLTFPLTSLFCNRPTVFPHQRA